MADSEIWGLTAETEVESTCRIPLQTNTGVDALYATAALLGGLQVSNQTVTTANITGAVGKLYVCTIAGLTAARDLTLPSAQVGERVGVYIVDGDATYELVIKGAASQTINGGSAATEWSRLFIQGECCVFRCVAANTWIVEFDGRIPCHFDAYLSTDYTAGSAGAYNLIHYDTTSANEGNTYSTSSFYATVRRAGHWSISHAVHGVAAYADGEVLANRIGPQGGGITAIQIMTAGGIANGFPLVASSVQYADGDTIAGFYYSATTDTNVDALTGSDIISRLRGMEML